MIKQVNYITHINQRIAMKLFLVTLNLFICISILNAQDTKRFKMELFNMIDSFTNVQYGEAINIKGEKQALLLDVFSPHDDTLKHRPLIIFIHGGGFQSNSKTGSYSSLICSGLAKRGYVTATIDYRLGIAKSKSDTAYFEAMYRAVQDAKASVRFFRRYAEKYGIDTSQIFIIGSSAGAKTAMHLAYMHQSDVPAYISATLGTVEGNSGNDGYSSRVNGVVNCWGAMIDYKWIRSGDVPLFNVAGLKDKTVPFDSSFSYHNFNYGAKILYHRALSLGIPTGFRPFENSGHTLDNNKLKQDSAYQDIAQWLFTRLKYHAPSKPEVFKWEKEIETIEKLGNTFNQKGAYNILFIGSSYIRLWGETMEEDLAPIKPINNGFGGSKLSDIAYYIDRLIANQHNVSSIYLYVGNDIVGSALDKTPLQVLELVKYITAKIRNQFPEETIYWSEISPSEKRWKVWGQIQESNRLIKDFCNMEKNLNFVETSSFYLSEKNYPKTEYYRDDHLHYNKEGYKVWGNILKKKIVKQ